MSIGICPALKISETVLESLETAGRVCTDGTVNEDGNESSGGEESEDPTPQPVIKKAQTITASGRTVPIDKAAFNLGVKLSGNGKLTYKSSNTKVASVSSTGKVTVKGYGVTTIIITATETSTCKAARKSVKVTVVPKKMTLTTAKSPARKTLILKWKKNKAATKYEVQLCKKKNFSRGALKRTYKNKITNAKIVNMPKKTWYVRIRAWKKIGGKTYYGIWSTVKRVKVK